MCTGGNLACAHVCVFVRLFVCFVLATPNLHFGQQFLCDVAREAALSTHTPRSALSSSTF
jgi:hypothetical protein